MRQAWFSRILVLLAAIATSGSVSADNPVSIEILTSHSYPVMHLEHKPGAVTVEIYELDGLERFEAHLSRDLPVDPARSKATVQQRIGALTETDLESVRRAALGLGLVVQYEIDRIPAAVVNEEAVVYGKTDAAEILERYEAWRATAP